MPCAGTAGSTTAGCGCGAPGHGSRSRASRAECGRRGSGDEHLNNVGTGTRGRPGRRARERNPGCLQRKTPYTVVAGNVATARMTIIRMVVDYQPHNDYMYMLSRHLSGSVLEALADTPAVLVNGARQTGKSTLVQSEELAGQARQYLTFDEPGVLAAAKRDPNGFIAGLNTPVTLDEVQHVPELFPVIKAAIDRKRQPGKFLLTGSANVMLLPKLSESLAGRMEVLTLWPFSQGEVRRIKENSWTGCFRRSLSRGRANRRQSPGANCWRSSPLEAIRLR